MKIVVSKKRMTAEFDDEVLDNLPPQTKDFLIELLKNPLAEYGNCQLIYAFLVLGGSIQEASKIMKQSLRQLKEQLLSLANQQLGKQIFDL